MNRNNFISDRLIYISNFLTQTEAISLVEKIDSLTEHSWRYDEGYKWVLSARDEAYT